MQVQSLGLEDPLEEGMDPHSSVLAWEFHGQRNMTDYSPWGHKELDMTERISRNMWLADTYRTAKS